MRVDVHHHAFPAEAVHAFRTSRAFGVEVDGDRLLGLDEGPFTIRPVNVDPAAKLELLTDNGLDGAVLSATPPLFLTRLEREASTEICRVVNGGLARFQQAEPDRFRWLALLPMGFPDAAVEVLGEAVAAGAAGIELPTNVGGNRFDGADYEPFWAEVERRGSPVFLHPAANEPHAALDRWHLDNVIGNLLETTVTAERLLLAGVLDRHPGLRILLAHAGGFFPFQAGRLRHARSVRPELEGTPEDPWAYRGRLLVDTITHDRHALAYLVGRMGVENVFLGTDMPAPMATLSPLVDLEAAVGTESAAAIASANPARLFGLG